MSAYGTTTIGATAAVIRAGKSTRRNIVIQNVHATNDLYVGTDANVLTTTGLKVAAGQSVTITDTGDVYGIASGAGTDVRWLATF